jgi:hypothetical protein
MPFGTCWQPWPPAGIWLPQVGEAERDGWPDEYAEAGIEATKELFWLAKD